MPDESMLVRRSVGTCRCSVGRAAGTGKGRGSCSSTLPVSPLGARTQQLPPRSLSEGPKRPTAVPDGEPRTIISEPFHRINQLPNLRSCLFICRPAPFLSLRRCGAHSCSPQSVCSVRIKCLSPPMCLSSHRVLRTQGIYPLPPAERSMHLD